MWKYTISSILALFMATAIAAESPLKTDNGERKISKRLEDKIGTVRMDEKIKVWVFFTDKEVLDQTALRKSAAEAGRRFTERAAERRRNRTEMGENYDFYDIPVSENYVDSLEALGMEIKRRSRWLNAVSAYADRWVISAAADLDFVARIKPVARGIRKPQPEIDSERGSLPENIKNTKKINQDLPDSVVAWYGASYTQLELTNIPIMHHVGYTGKNILIAVFDTGFKLSHPAFDNTNVIDQYDFVNDDDDVTDEIPSASQLSHGTAVLSVIGGTADSSLIGSAYGADFIVAKTEIVNEEILVEEDNWVAASEWADSLGADVISSSLAYLDWYTYADLDGETAVITIAAEVAVSRGIVVVNSAGNERNDAFFWITPPADGEHVIAVGAVNSNGEITSFSSSGPTYDGRVKPDVVAMGSGIVRAVYSNNAIAGGASGTSYSAPITGGVAALLLEAHPTWTPDDVRQALIESADRYESPDSLYGYGLYDVYKASRLMNFNPIPAISLAVGDSLNLTISVFGFEDESGVTAISALNLPSSAELTDNGDRTATLKYSGKMDDLGSRTVTFEAVSGDVSISDEISFTVTAQRTLAAGPNPFEDSLMIFLGAGSGEVQEISIFTPNGEKVWDNFSDTYNSVTGTVVWKGINNSGAEVTTGVYLVYVRTESLTEKFKVFKK